MFLSCFSEGGGEGASYAALSLVSCLFGLYVSGLSAGLCVGLLVVCLSTSYCCCCRLVVVAVVD